MTRTPDSSWKSPLSFPLGVVALTLLVGGSATTGLMGQETKEREKKPERQAPPAPAPRPAPEARREAPEPRREIRPEVRSEPRREPTPEPRREVRPEPRREPAPSVRMETPSRHEPVPSPRPLPTPEPRHDPAPLQHPAPLNEPRRESGSQPRPDAPPTMRIAPRQEPSRNPAQAPRLTMTPDRQSGGRLGPERQVVRTPQGGEIHRAASGAIREVHTPGGAIVLHAPTGARQVELTRPGGRLIVANATGRTGFVQRPITLNNHTYVQRTYVYQGAPQVRVYRPWSQGNVTLQVYTPTTYYRPAFYAWGHRSWGRPVRYRWGWEGRHWYGYYGGYFTPYATYDNPCFWLADFLLASTLEAAYLAQNAAVSAPPMTYSQDTGLGPDVKKVIAEEVRRQLEQDRAEQAAYQAGISDRSLPAIFSENGPKVFVVHTTTYAYNGDRECPLVEGDVLQLLGTPYPEDETTDVRVLASRGGSCGKGSVVSVRLTDLQEMQNHLRATLHQGLGKLQSGQGRDGLPALSLDERGTVNTSFANEVRADAGALEEVTRAASEANRAEQEMIAQNGPDTGSTTGSATIRLGMSLSEVERALGRPQGTVDLGKKKIYLYKDLKITFLNGRVSDVQ